MFSHLNLMSWQKYSTLYYYVIITEFIRFYYFYFSCLCNSSKLFFFLFFFYNINWCTVLLYNTFQSQINYLFIPKNLKKKIFYYFILSSGWIHYLQKLKCWEVKFLTFLNLRIYISYLLHFQLSYIFFFYNIYKLFWA